jgi:hypothetical protein
MASDRRLGLVRLLMGDLSKLWDHVPQRTPLDERFVCPHSSAAS